MNFTRYMNDKIYAEYTKGKALAIGEKKGHFDDATTIDLDGADINGDINELHDIPGKYDTIRMCEILEHLTQDYNVLLTVREALNDDGRLLITVPYYGEANYHVRLHNKWSITQLLNIAGFDVETYIPRKAPVIDKFIKYVRGALFFMNVNEMFYRLNDMLPVKPNGGYLICKKSKTLDITDVNKKEFTIEKHAKSA